VRARESGDEYFIEMKAAINSRLPLNEAHRITSELEEKITEIFPKANVMVHPEPVFVEEGIYEYALRMSESVGARLHDFTLLENPKGIEISIHLEWDGETLFKDAWSKSKTIEKEIQKKFGESTSVFVHFEPLMEKLKKMEKGEDQFLKAKIDDLIKSLPSPLFETKAKIIESEGIVHIHLLFPVDSLLTIDKVHALSSLLEKEISKIAPENSHTLAQPVPKEEFCQ
ncbi:MAG: hypothetical protein N2445_00805, partial [Acidobacteria bacterium]|nr:hypothetical protein [Acidobacteriota bacterium]